jgi:hypothetical protein
MFRQRACCSFSSRPDYGSKKVAVCGIVYGLCWNFENVLSINSGVCERKGENDKEIIVATCASSRLEKVIRVCFTY